MLAIKVQRLGGALFLDFSSYDSALELQISKS
jgi:hypothetical protein